MKQSITITVVNGTGRFLDATGLWKGTHTLVGKVQEGPYLYVHNLTGGTGTLTY